jgi:hypothetical protein
VLFTANDCAKRLRIRLRIPSRDCAPLEPREPEVLGHHDALAYCSGLGQLADACRSARAHFVEPVLAADDPRVPTTESPERTGCNRTQCVLVYTDELMGRSSRIREGSERVEDRASTKLAPGLRRMLERRMVRLCEEERDPSLAQDLAMARDGYVDGDAERLDDVCAPATARYRTVAVLCHRQAARRDDDRRSARQVQCVRAVSSRAACVDDKRQLVLDRRHRCPHGLRSSDDLLGAFTTHPQGNREGPHLHRRPCPGKDRVERGAHVGDGERLAREQTGEKLGEVRAHRILASQLLTNRFPCVVKTLSG